MRLCKINELSQVELYFLIFRNFALTLDFVKPNYLWNFTIFVDFISFEFCMPITAVGPLLSAILEAKG